MVDLREVPTRIGSPRALSRWRFRQQFQVVVGRFAEPYAWVDDQIVAKQPRTQSHFYALTQPGHHIFKQVVILVAVLVVHQEQSGPGFRGDRRDVRVGP